MLDLEENYISIPSRFALLRYANTKMMIKHIDPPTGFKIKTLIIHPVNVAFLSLVIGRWLNLDNKINQLSSYWSLLDIGKQR